MSGAFRVHWNTFEGEYLDKVWLKEVSWKGTPKRVIAPYLKITLCSLLFFLSISRNESLERNRPNYSAKAKYYDISDSEPVP